MVLSRGKYLTYETLRKTICPPSPTLLLWREVRFWYLVTLKNHIWTAKKCILRQRMWTQTAHRVPTTENFSIFFSFFEKLSVCATCVYIHCLTIRFLAAQIWYFNVTKYQKRISLQSSKVGGVQKIQLFRPFWDFEPKIWIFSQFSKITWCHDSIYQIQVELWCF